MRIDKIEIIGTPAEPITLTEAKEWCNFIGGTEQDNNFNRVIKGVRVYAENYMNRALVPQTITASTTDYEELKLELPRLPVISISLVERIKNNIAEPYTGYERVGPEHIELRPHLTGWLSTGWDKYFYRVTYVAGEVGSIPDDMKVGLLKMLKSCYEDRGNFVKGTIVSKLMQSSEEYLGPYRTKISLHH